MKGGIAGIHQDEAMNKLAYHLINPYYNHFDPNAPPPPLSWHFGPQTILDGNRDTRVITIAQIHTWVQVRMLHAPIDV